MTLDCTCNRLIEAEAKAAKWDALVRCGECKHYEEPADSDLKPYCVSRLEGTPIPPNVFRGVKPDGFCAWGERKKGE